MRKPKYGKGYRVGRLTLTGNTERRDFTKYKDGKIKARLYYEAKCDCGSIVWRRTEGLRFQEGVTQNCDCYSLELSKDFGNRRYLGYGVASTRGLYKKYENQAKRRKYEFTLTLEEFITLISSNCTYCGDPPSQLIGRYKDKEKQIKYTGVDRKDSNIGYILDNCVPCCKICNFAKHKVSSEDFKTWVKKVYKNLFDENI